MVAVPMLLLGTRHHHPTGSGGRGLAPAMRARARISAPGSRRGPCPRAPVLCSFVSTAPALGDSRLRPPSPAWGGHHKGRARPPPATRATASVPPRLPLPLVCQPPCSWQVQAGLGQVVGPIVQTKPQPKPKPAPPPPLYLTSRCLPADPRVGVDPKGGRILVLGKASTQIGGRGGQAGVWGGSEQAGAWGTCRALEVAKPRVMMWPSWRTPGFCPGT